MDVRRLRGFLGYLIEEYDRTGIVRAAAQCQTDLQNWTNQPNEENATKYSEAVAELEQVASTSSLDVLQPVQRRMMDQIGGTKFLPS